MWGAAAPAFAHGVWTNIPSPAPRSPLHAVKFVNRVEAWAVGDTGTVLKLKDGEWRNATSGTDEHLLGLAVLSATEAWAVGENGTLLHYDGVAWTPHRDSRTAATRFLPLRAVAFLNPGNGWAVGGREAGVAAAEGIVLRYDGSTWTSATSTSDALYDLALVSSDNIRFCGGNRRIMRYDGTSYRLEAGPVADGGTWHALAFPFASQGWAVGDGGWIARFSAGTWSAVTSPVTDNLKGVVVLADPDTGYVVGDAGARLHLNAGVVELEAREGDGLAAVALANGVDGAAVGGTTLPRMMMVRALTDRTDLKGLRAFPNPYDPGTGRPFTLDRLPGDVTGIRITTMLGETVAEIGSGVAYTSAVGVATWPGRLADGSLAASGVYNYRVTAPGGAAFRGVFLVARR